MMQTLFCTECGNKMLYSGAKPKFCSSCGTPIGKTIKKSVTPETTSKSFVGMPTIKEKIQARHSKVNLNEDETDINYVPKVNNFQCDFTSSGNATYKLGDIIENAEETGSGSKREGNTKDK